MIKRVITEAALQAFQRRLVQIADRTVTPIDGMYEDTDAGRALLEQYNARPIDEAYAIINSQTVYPMCLSCDHPIIDGKAHMGYCAEERTDCPSNNLELTLPELFEAKRCTSSECHHLPLARSELCSCCTESMIYKCLSCNNPMATEGLCATCCARVLTQLTMLANVSPMFLVNFTSDSPLCAAYSEDEGQTRTVEPLRQSAELRFPNLIVQMLSEELDPAETARMQRLLNESVCTGEDT